MASYDLKRMIEMLKAGASNKAIAAELSVSIGTVAGRRFRLNRDEGALPVEPKPTSNPRSAKPVPKVSEVLRVKMVIREKKHHGPRNLDILSLKASYCRWPKDGGLYCAATVVNGLPYCHEHCMQAYPIYAAKHPGGLNDGR